MFRNLKRKWRGLFPRIPFAVPYWGCREAWTILWLAVTGRIVHGSAVSRLENRIGQLLGRRYCLGTNLGRTALELALRGLGYGPGDEVILPSYCCGSVLAAVLRAGCRPVFADVADDLNIDPASVRDRISPRTRAMIVPHLFGSPALIDVLEHIARENGFALIDDAAQAFGARLGGRLLGTFGDVAVLSFGPGKSVTATGGGILVTDRTDVADRVHSIQLEAEPYWPKLRQAVAFAAFRWLRRYTVGWWTLVRRLLPAAKQPSEPDPFPLRKLANVDAAIAWIQLDKLDCGMAIRRQHAEVLRERLEGCKAIELVRASNESARTKCAAVIRTDVPGVSAAEFRAWLAGCGIEVWPSYGALHESPDMAHLRNGSLPRTEALAERIVFLANDPSMSQADVLYVAQCCEEFFRAAGP